MDALLYLAIGLGLGVLTSMPIGVANAAVVDAALRVGRRRALGIAAGGATADTVHASLAFAGLAPLLAAHATWSATFFAISGAAIIAYGVHVARARTEPAPPAGERMAGAFVVGLLLTVTNPAALMAWMVVASAIGPGEPLHGAVLGAGVGVGAFAWFAALAILTSRGDGLGSARRHLISRVIGGVLIVLGAVSLFRGAHQLLS